MYNVKEVHLAFKKWETWSNTKALYGPLMDQGWGVTLWKSALVSLESGVRVCVCVSMFGRMPIFIW